MSLMRWNPISQIILVNTLQQVEQNLKSKSIDGRITQAKRNLNRPVSHLLRRSTIPQELQILLPIQKHTGPKQITWWILRQERNLKYIWIQNRNLQTIIWNEIKFSLKLNKTKANNIWIHSLRYLHLNNSLEKPEIYQS